MDVRCSIAIEGEILHSISDRRVKRPASVAGNTQEHQPGICVFMIPDEILLKIFWFLKQYVVVARCVCRRWRRVAADNALKKILEKANKYTFFDITCCPVEFVFPSESVCDDLDVLGRAVVDNFVSFVGKTTIPGDRFRMWWLVHAGAHNNFEMLVTLVGKCPFRIYSYVTFLLVLYTTNHDIFQYTIDRFIKRSHLTECTDLMDNPSPRNDGVLSAYVLSACLKNADIEDSLVDDGHIKGLTFMVEHGFPLRSRCFKNAVRHGRLNVIECYMNCKATKSVGLDDIKNADTLALLNAACMIEDRPSHDVIVAHYIATDNLDVLKQICHNGEDYRTAIAQAGGACSDKILQWLSKNTATFNSAF